MENGWKHIDDRQLSTGLKNRDRVLIQMENDYVIIASYYKKHLENGQPYEFFINEAGTKINIDMVKYFQDVPVPIK